MLYYLHHYIHKLLEIALLKKIHRDCITSAFPTLLFNCFGRRFLTD